MIKYHCIMSHYPMDEPANYMIPNSGVEVDLNCDFWEEVKSFEKEEDFDEWVAHHPYKANMVMVLDVVEA